MKQYYFNDIEELIETAKKLGAYEDWILLAKNYDDLNNLLKECPKSFRIWAIINGFVQFIETCDWDKFNGDDWCVLLSLCPQFVDKCNWDKLSYENWIDLLLQQPHLVNKCDWEKLKRMRDEYFYCK